MGFRDIGTRSIAGRVALGLGRQVAGAAHHIKVGSGAPSNGRLWLWYVLAKKK